MLVVLGASELCLNCSVAGENTLVVDVNDCCYYVFFILAALCTRFESDFCFGASVAEPLEKRLPNPAHAGRRHAKVLGGSIAAGLFLEKMPPPTLRMLLRAAKVFQVKMFDRPHALSGMGRFLFSRKKSLPPTLRMLLRAATVLGVWL